MPPRALGFGHALRGFGGPSLRLRKPSGWEHGKLEVLQAGDVRRCDPLRLRARSARGRRRAVRGGRRSDRRRRCDTVGPRRGAPAHRQRRGGRSRTRMDRRIERQAERAWIVITRKNTPSGRLGANKASICLPRTYLSRRQGRWFSVVIPSPARDQFLALNSELAHGISTQKRERLPGFAATALVLAPRQSIPMSRLRSRTGVALSRWARHGLARRSHARRRTAPRESDVDMRSQAFRPRPASGGAGR